MNVVNKSIEMVFYTNAEGSITPNRFRIRNDDDEYVVCKINKIFFTDKDDRALTILFRCATTINDISRTVEIKLDKKSCKWYLYRI